MTSLNVDNVGWSLNYLGTCLTKKEVISSGSYGTVSLYVNQTETIQFAVKTFERREDYWAEVQAIEYLRENSVKFCNKMPANPLATKKNSYKPRVIIMPVLDRIEEMKLNQSDWLQTINDIQGNISCLRGGNLFYTDLKPANLLWQKATNPPHVYLGDLGGIGSLKNSEFTTTYAQEYQDAWYNPGSKDKGYNDRGFLVFDIIYPNPQKTPKSTDWSIINRYMQRFVDSPDWWCTFKLGPVDQRCFDLERNFKAWERPLSIMKDPEGENLKLRVNIAINDDAYKNQIKLRIVEAIQCKELLCLIARKIEPLPKKFKDFCNDFEQFPFSKSYEDVVNAFQKFILFPRKRKGQGRRAQNAKKQRTDERFAHVLRF